MISGLFSMWLAPTLARIRRRTTAKTNALARVFYNPMTGDKFAAHQGRVDLVTVKELPRAFQHQHHDAIRSLQRQSKSVGQWSTQNSGNRPKDG